MEVPVEALLDGVEDSLGDKAVNTPAVSTGTTTGTTGTTAAAWDPLSVLTAGTAVPAARFRYDVRSGDGWWSPRMFELHGLVDGEVAPSTDLLMSHKHPDDLAATAQTLRRVLATGEAKGVLVAAFTSSQEDDRSAARRACACLGLAALDEDQTAAGRHRSRGYDRRMRAPDGP